MGASGRKNNAGEQIGKIGPQWKGRGRWVKYTKRLTGKARRNAFKQWGEDALAKNFYRGYYL